MGDLKEILQVVNSAALVTAIFLIGAANQRLKSVEEWIKSHKVDSAKVDVLKNKVENLNEQGKELRRSIEKVRERCFELHNEQ